MFARGFKSWCENISLQIRKDIGLGRTDSLSASALAEYLGCLVWTPEEIEGLSPQSLNTLLKSDCDNWSAVTVTFDEVDAIIYNPTHSAARRSSDLMHEMSHLVIGHEPSTVFLTPDGSLALRSYDRRLEDEANWLSGCLLLPRPALLRIVQEKTDNSAACDHYGVSNDLLQYRLNATGVMAQMRRRKTS